MSDGNTTTIISLRGAAQLIKDYFLYGTNSYLYRRAVLPATTFQREKKYGVTMLVATGQNVKVLMASALLQVDYYLAKGQLKRLVSVISAVETKEVVERWQFDIHTDGVAAESETARRTNTDTEFQEKMRDVLRQINSSVSSLPRITVPVSVKVVMFTGTGDDMNQWTQTEAFLVMDSSLIEVDHSAPTAVVTPSIVRGRNRNGNDFTLDFTR